MNSTSMAVQAFPRKMSRQSAHQSALEIAGAFGPLPPQRSQRKLQARPICDHEVSHRKRRLLHRQKEDARQKRLHHRVRWTNNSLRLLLHLLSQECSGARPQSRFAHARAISKLRLRSIQERRVVSCRLEARARVQSQLRHSITQ